MVIFVLFLKALPLLSRYDSSLLLVLHCGEFPLSKARTLGARTVLEVEASARRAPAHRASRDVRRDGKRCGGCAAR